MKELIITLILAPLMVNILTKLISDWLDSKRGKHSKR
ncbi:type I toxin-antitoxin system Fst family toxin [Streptococcus pneumoniae]